MAVAHKSKIEFEIGLDENKVPETISWSAEDGGIDKYGEQSRSLVHMGPQKERHPSHRFVDKRHACRRDEAIFSPNIGLHEPFL